MRLIYKFRLLNVATYLASARWWEPSADKAVDPTFASSRRILGRRGLAVPRTRYKCRNGGGRFRRLPLSFPGKSKCTVIDNARMQEMQPRALPDKAKINLSLHRICIKP